MAHTNEEQLRLKRNCNQCGMCEMCKRKILAAEMKERRKMKFNEKTCEKCGLTVKCDDCIKCPKCQHACNKAKSTISIDKSDSLSLSRSSSASLKVQIGSSEAKRSDTLLPKCDAKLDYKKEVEKMANWYPPHIDPAKHPLIPYPLPAPAVELRAGRFMSMCLCLKRNGLQSDCPKTGCQGNPECMRYLVPACIPSGFTLPGAKESFLQKADDPECYSKCELLKGQQTQEKPTRTATGAAGDGDVDVQPKPASPKEVDPTREKQMAASVTKLVRFIPNEPPNYISEPPVNDYKAPCRRHAKHGFPGSQKYTKYSRCRLKVFDEQSLDE
ncbi:uncharacterized protein isoform X2 [Rhodnius prolixus]|uniref:uncharacterized protein isoform X2 n=1 Tax=Rhodnius prolixus TaxID=13249 RepID=UPI003D18E778